MASICNIKLEILAARNAVLQSAGAHTHKAAREFYLECIEHWMPWIDDFGRPLGEEYELPDEYLPEDYLAFRKRYRERGPSTTFVNDFRQADLVAVCHVIDGVSNDGSQYQTPQRVVAFRCSEVFKGESTGIEWALVCARFLIREYVVELDPGEEFFGLLYPYSGEIKRVSRQTGRGSKMLIVRHLGRSYLASRPYAADYWLGFETVEIASPKYFPRPSLNDQMPEVLVLWDDVRNWMEREKAAAKRPPS